MNYNDYLLRFDFSKATELKIDEILNDNSINDLIKELIHTEQINIAREYDKNVIKSAFLKAQLYDLNCNPFTVKKKEKEKAVKDFCNWILKQDLTKKEIIKILKEQVK